MRRLPVYLVIDTSGSMRGESIHSVNVLEFRRCLALFARILRLESVHISIITYDNEAREFILSRRWKTSSFLTSLCQAQAGRSPVLPLNV
jgi:uncharacterized protein YegL